jgi:hypothetical protein
MSRTAAATTKSRKAAPVVVERIRKPAAEAMADRGRMTIGAAFIRDVKDGVQRDWGKQLALAVAMGLGTRKVLEKLDGPELREKLAAALKTAKKGSIPASVSPDGEVLTVH